ncbi:MAG: hypothetical protein LUE99_09840 [Bacteroides sp.]|nr:hypothetical protein [Bacteroides sp.]
MKRTTYIILGALLGGLLVMCGGIFYLSTLGVSWEDTCLKIDGERKTVQLPECRVVKFAMEPYSEDVIISLQGWLNVEPAEAAVGSLAYVDGLDKYMTLQSAGDTLQVTFKIGKDDVDGKLRGRRWMGALSGEMGLKIPASVRQVIVETMVETTFSNFRCDTLSFSVHEVAKVQNCRIASLEAEARSLHFNSGMVDNLHLNLDGIQNWKVNTDSFYIDTEHLAATYRSRCNLQKGECRRVLWRPLGPKAALDLELKQAVKIEVAEQ